jgi:N-acetylglucosamine kinase-like BadF-type ATPase
VDLAALHARVAELQRLLAEGDAAAINIFEEAVALFSAAFGTRAEEIRTLVKGYRFAEALHASREASVPAAV